MNLPDIIIYTVSILISLGTLAGGVGYLWGKVKVGNKEVKNESVDLIRDNDAIKQFYKEQNDDLKEINKVLGLKVESLIREVGELKGQLNAEMAQRKEYQLILENRDPETKKFMDHMVQSIRDHSETHKEIIRVLSEIHAMTKAEYRKDFTVESTITKQ